MEHFHEDARRAVKMLRPAADGRKRYEVRWNARRFTDLAEPGYRIALYNSKNFVTSDYNPARRYPPGPQVSMLFREIMQVCLASGKGYRSVMSSVKTRH
jgi:hypothetical protein